jgi:hypothetical protein
VSTPSRQQSVREVAGTIRHLDASRARELVAAFGRPCSLDEHGVAGNVEDEVVTGAGGRVTLDGRTTQGVAAEPVANWKTHLHLHGLLRLPLSVARELAKHPGHIYLDKVATITDAVADVLRDHAGGCLSLDNLREISGHAAGALGRHAGDVSLNGLTRLSTRVALGLSQHSAELFLNGVTDLASVPTTVISRHRGHLHLNGIESLSERLAIQLSQYRGRLHLHGVRSLSDEAAEAFGSRIGHLCVPGIARLSAQQAESLSGHHGALHLKSIRLDDATAYALGRHRGSLFIRLSNDVPIHRLEAIARHQGPLEISGLTDLDVSQARVLASQVGPRGIPGLSCLFIDTVSRLSPEVATILATHSGGGLCFSGIRELSPDVARALVRHPILCLDVLAGVSDEVAAILATHTGTTLSLRGLRDASSRAIALLKAAPSVELPRRLATSRGPEAPPSAGRPFSTSNAGLRGDDLIRALQRIAMEGDVVMRQATDQEDSAM